MKKHHWAFKPPLWITLVTLLGATLLCGLGYWQLSRGQEKQALLDQAADARDIPPLNSTALLAMPVPSNKERYLPVKFKGTWINQFSILLDNKIENGQVGYHLLTPIALDEHHWLLVDRGFVPLGHSRSNLPKIPPILGEVSIEGYLDFSYRNPFISSPLETQEIQWPLRMQHLDIPLLSALWHKEIYPMVVVLGSKPSNSKSWLSPEKHRGYAVQWFALALTLMLCYVFTHLRWKNKLC